MKRKYFKNNVNYFLFLKKWLDKIEVIKVYFTHNSNICIVYKLIKC